MHACRQASIVRLIFFIDAAVLMMGGGIAGNEKYEKKNVSITVLS